MDKTQIARIAHEINRAYCEAIDDPVQVPWKNTKADLKVLIIDGVEFHLANEVTPEESHINWMEHKVQNGWIYGGIKDEEKKIHPCLVPYRDLPLVQKVKDYLFKAIVDQLSRKEDVTESKLPVKYIGHRVAYKDGIFQTGVYAKGETKLVPANIARQMFKHKDVYVNGDKTKAESIILETADKKSDSDPDNPVDIQDAIDSVMNMRDKAAILEFAATQFSNVRLDKRCTLDNLQQETIQMIHQYGLT